MARTYNYRCPYPKNTESIKRFDEYQSDLFYRKSHIFSFDTHVANAYFDDGLLVLLRGVVNKSNRVDIYKHMRYVAKEWGLILVVNVYGSKLRRVD
jgi:hypothetical protein